MREADISWDDDWVTLFPNISYRPRNNGEENKSLIDFQPKHAPSPFPSLPPVHYTMHTPKLTAASEQNAISAALDRVGTIVNRWCGVGKLNF